MMEPLIKEEHYSVRWTSHTNNLIHMFTEHRLNERLADVTLVCEGQFIKAHKIILSSCSSYFQEMFKINGGMSGCIVHPFLIFTSEKFNHLTHIIQFIYQGEIKVPESDLEGVLAMGEKFQIKGLCSIRAKHKVQTDKPSTIPIPNLQTPAVDINMSQTLVPKSRSILKNAMSDPQAIELPYSHKLPVIPVPALVPTSYPVVPQDRSLTPSKLNEHPTSMNAHALKQPSDSPLDTKRIIDLNISLSPKEKVVTLYHTPLDNERTMDSNISALPKEKEVTSSSVDTSDLQQPLRKKIRTDFIAKPKLTKTDTQQKGIVSDTNVQKSTHKKDEGNAVIKNKPTNTLREVTFDEKSNVQSEESISTEKKQSKSLNPFMIFASEWRKKLAVEHPGETNKEISVRLGNLWKTLSSETKQRYYTAAQWNQEPEKTPAVGCKKVLQRRKTIDSVQHWNNKGKESEIPIIDLDEDFSSGKNYSHDGC